MPDLPSPLPLTSLATFGDLLKYLRRRARLSQRDLSIAVGYSESQISRLESNQRPPDAATLAALFAPALGIEDEPETLARLLELAAAARGESAPERGITGEAIDLEGAASASDPHNLPHHLTSFVGREKEMAEVKRLLSRSPERSEGAAKHPTRLLTLTGPGGTGKTRLALQVAANLLNAFSDGVWLVEFAPVSNPALVPQTVATTLEVREEPGRLLLATLISHLRAKKLLLILDNCEHLIQSCAQLAETLLHAFPGLNILATSREE
ncbi:MAG: ATP-binding protein, partial [Anaerolineales bacterium]